MRQALELSVVVPVYNEAGNVRALAAEIAQVLDGRAFEMVFVDDGSTDDTRAALESLRSEIPHLRVVQHRRNAGQSRAVRSGVERAIAPVVATLDGDGQNDPADLPTLYRALTSPEAPSTLALVMGERMTRQDGAWRRWGSASGNWLRRLILRDGARDSGCGAKVFRRSAFLALPYFDHMHRFLPALFRADGHDVEYRPVNHRPRLSGQSKYTNLGRLAAAFSDVRGVAWLARRRRETGGIDEV